MRTLNPVIFSIIFCLSSQVYSQSVEAPPELMPKDFVLAATQCVKGIRSKQNDDRFIKKNGWKKVIKGKNSNLYEHSSSRILLILPTGNLNSKICIVRGHIKGSNIDKEYRELLDEISNIVQNEFNFNAKILNTTYQDLDKNTPVLHANDIMIDDIRGQIVLEKSYSGFLVDMFFQRIPNPS